MRLRSLELTNFRQHASSRLEFGTGITGIIGRNGVGKSTVLEAIAWALYGQPAARGTKESIKYQRAPARAGVKVELEFDLTGHRYRVVRSLVSADLYLDGAFEPIASSLSAVTDVLQRTLGMTRQEFFQTYFTGQKDLAVMAAMGATERAHFLTRVLGYDQLRVAQDCLRERRRELTGELTGMRAGLPDPAQLQDSLERVAQILDEQRARLTAVQREHATAQSEEAASRPAWDLAEQAKTAHIAFAADLRDVERARARNEQQLRDLTVEAEELDRRREELGILDGALTGWSELQPKREAHERLFRASLQLEQLAGEGARVMERTRQLHARVNSIESDTSQRDTWAREIGEIIERRNTFAREERDARTEWTTALQSARSERDQLRTQYSKLKAERARIAALGADGPCPTCTRVLGDSLATMLEVFDAQLRAIQTQGARAAEAVTLVEPEPAALGELAAELSRFSEQHAGVQRRVAEFEAAQIERARLQRDLKQLEADLVTIDGKRAQLPMGYDAAVHASLEREIARLTPMHAHAITLRAQVDRIPVVHAKIVGLRTEGTDLERQALALEEACEQTGHSEASYVAARDAYQLLADRVRISELSLVRAQADLEVAERANAAAVQALEDARNRQEQAERVARDTRLHNELDRIYGGLRTELNERLRPELSAIASEYLAALTEGRYAELELDAQFNVVVLEDGRPKPVISGGEEDLTNIALRLAISQMIAERNGHRFSLLILDEIFGSLDEQRQANVVDLLRSLESRFEQVILITHLPVVRGQAHEILLDYDASAGCTVVRSVA